jgi:NTE family protein
MITTRRARLRACERRMRDAQTYEEWSEAARAHDDASGMTRWKQMDQTYMYDHVAIRTRLDRLRAHRARHDYHGLLFTLNEGIHGNIGGMGKASLHARARFGTKQLVNDYTDEICDALELIAGIGESVIPFSEKLDFFKRASHCYGRTALMLSGGGALGHFHAGVVKSLVEHDILPTIISGSSAGSINAAVIGCSTPEELQRLFEPTHFAVEAAREARFLDNIIGQRTPQVDVHELEELVARLVPDLTFAEAYERTGISINVSIAPAELQQASRLLNAITSPNVFVRKAVMASCAVPGVFPPVMLSAKNVHGDSQPYLPSLKWIDGSVSDDLPAKRLARLYGVNHYVASQINPVVLPFIRDPGTSDGLANAYSGLLRSIAKESIRAAQKSAQRYSRQLPRFNMLLSMATSIAVQNYTADINIFPGFRYFDPTKLLSHLSEAEILRLIKEGERSTWPKIENIRVCTRISRTLDRIRRDFKKEELARLEGRTGARKNNSAGRKAA